MKTATLADDPDLPYRADRAVSETQDGTATHLPHPSDGRMVSAEATALFAKACEIFITELSMRAWICAEESKRRTLQRADIARAASQSDMLDFLIDIVPRNR
ncbi:hypothetical protein CANCADRAFT_31388 [Tortispora caseinolytica NRRL Y-17796]|uniref:Core Histone H2A/H2B/H3 domain-containing protein n=1 Tax=Tortispora caseinolytica NRRL Y-17796 TaxID=767744 RepID=A0A1E4TF89_9ASCO|nr:hypothetical protein CANCADRAFT_31388 [Tortispora caseinolytica NRRL Y-17796]